MDIQIHKDIVKKFKQDLLTASLDVNKPINITLYTPSLLAWRLKEEGFYPQEKKKQLLLIGLISQYTEKLNQITNDKEEVSLATTRMKKLLNAMEKNELTLKSMHCIVMHEMEELCRENNIRRAEKHREIMLEFTNKYTDLCVDNNITNSSNNLKYVENEK